MKIDLEGKEASLMRNIIAHNYMGIKVSIAIKTLEISIPKLKSKVQTFLNEENL